MLISDGGPDILIPEALLNSWSGYAGEDYGAACELGLSNIVVSMLDKPVWVFGGSASATCVGNADDGVVILRILAIPEKFRLPLKTSDISEGIVGPTLTAFGDSNAILMAAACTGENIYESDGIYISYKSGTLLTSRRLTTQAGGDYLIYHITKAKADGGNLRTWLYQKAISFEHRDGFF